MTGRGYEWLLAAFPRAWRERYGEELVSLLEAEAEANGGRLAVLSRLDVLRSGVGERLRASGLRGDDLPAPARARAGVLLVLCSWAAFVVAGIALQKMSEHWQAVTPAADRGLPRAAFDGVRVAAVLGTLATLAGVALVTRPVLALLRSGGRAQIRRPLGVALGITGLTTLALVAVVTWAHQLPPAARNGSDALYGLAFLGLVLGVVATIAAWTAAAVEIASRLVIPQRTLRRETTLAGAVALAMAAVTVSTFTWWLTVTASASGFGPGFPWLMVVIATVMVASTGLALAGSDRAIRAVRATGPTGPGSA